MFEKKFAVEDLYILHVSELVYFVPLDNEGVYYNDYFTKEYYTIASSRDGKNFKDVFKFDKYKKDGYVGFGVMRDIAEMIPLQSYAVNIASTLNRKEAAMLLNSFVNEINQYVKTTPVTSERCENKKLGLVV